MLSDKHFHNLSRAYNAITNVLQGRTADGNNPISTTVSFTTDISARRAAAHQLRLIFCHCHRVLDLDDITPLTIKFLWHLTRTGNQTNKAILGFPIIPMIHAIKNAPHMVRGKASLLAILRKHHQDLSCERAKQWHILNVNVPERTLLWSNGVYTLEEANDPRHLVYDTLSLGHCVGSLYCKAALAHHQLTADHPDAIRYLHYWLKIKHGEARIVTLFEADTPLITIDFHVATKTITSAQGQTTPLGEVLPLPLTLKAPLYESIKALPVAKRGAVRLRSLIFEPDCPQKRLQRISRFTPL